jgi:eukaryotic-like serine/threonine-protein kinase
MKRDDEFEALSELERDAEPTFSIVPRGRDGFDSSPTLATSLPRMSSEDSEQPTLEMHGPPPSSVGRSRPPPSSVGRSRPPPSSAGMPTPPSSSAGARGDLGLPLVHGSAYEIGPVFAQGGAGRILMARDRRLNRPVALKELRDTRADTEERFVREALVTARLQHPAIVPVYEAGRWPSGDPFYAMRLVSGRSLGDVLDEARTLEQRLALLHHIVVAADAIAYAHSQRIIHRDLKPANILVGAFGETLVIDWGLAKDLGARGGPEPALSLPGLQPEDDGSQPPGPPLELTAQGSIMGTPSYMPPEQALGKPVDERADVYSLGAILYRLLAGVKPYDGRNSFSILRQVLEGPPIPVEERQRGIPEDLLAIVRKAMARDPSQRYRTAKELAEELRRFETGRIVGARSSSFEDWLGATILRHAAVLTAAAVVLLVLAGVGAFSIASLLAARMD